MGQGITVAPTSKLRWDRQYALFADSVLAGRDGRCAEADLLAAAVNTGAPYPTGRLAVSEFGATVLRSAGTLPSRPPSWPELAQPELSGARICGRVRAAGG